MHHCEPLQLPLRDVQQHSRGGVQPLLLHHDQQLPTSAHGDDLRHVRQGVHGGVQQDVLCDLLPLVLLDGRPMLLRDFQQLLLPPCAHGGVLRRALQPYRGDARLGFHRLLLLHDVQQLLLPPYAHGGVLHHVL